MDFSFPCYLLQKLDYFLKKKITLPSNLFLSSPLLVTFVCLADRGKGQARGASEFFSLPPWLLLRLASCPFFGRWFRPLHSSFFLFVHSHVGRPKRKERRKRVSFFCLGQNRGRPLTASRPPILSSVSPAPPTSATTTSLRPPPPPSGIINMSWQSYVDDQLLSTKMVKHAVICGHDGNIWATSPSFSVSGSTTPSGSRPPSWLGRDLSGRSPAHLDEKKAAIREGKEQRKEGIGYLK